MFQSEEENSVFSLNTSLFDRKSLFSMKLTFTSSGPDLIQRKLVVFVSEGRETNVIDAKKLRAS